MQLLPLRQCRTPAVYFKEQNNPQNKKQTTPPSLLSIPLGDLNNLPQKTYPKQPQDDKTGLHSFIMVDIQHMCMHKRTHHRLKSLQAKLEEIRRVIECLQYLQKQVIYRGNSRNA